MTCDSCEAIRRSVGNSEAKAKAEGEAKAGEALRYSRSPFDQKFSLLSGVPIPMLLPLDVNLSCHVRVLKADADPRTTEIRGGGVHSSWTRGPVSWTAIGQSLTMRSGRRGRWQVVEARGRRLRLAVTDVPVGGACFFDAALSSALLLLLSSPSTLRLISSS